ncbi:uncharacterized protein [Typha angustifolia]|uniref:uncharacterized protein n=1 Tax=Typha angustifolia TaxID=59011 RepID=UPI003C2EE480
MTITRSNRNTEEPSVLSMLGSISKQIAINKQIMMEMMQEIRAWTKPFSTSKAITRQHWEPSTTYPTSSTASPFITKIGESSAIQQDRDSTPRPMVSRNELPPATMRSSTIVAALGTSTSSHAPETLSTNREVLATPHLVAGYPSSGILIGGEGDDPKPRISTLGLPFTSSLCNHRESATKKKSHMASSDLLPFSSVNRQSTTTASSPVMTLQLPAKLQLKGEGHDLPPMAAEGADVAGHRGEEVEEQQHVEDTKAEISLDAYSGTAAPKTLRVNGVIKKTTVRILIDTGSTHNFIDMRLLRKIGLESEPTEGFDVTIGDGTTLRADSICGGAELKVQDQIFTLDLYPLALQGADIVLGTQWLRSLGPVTFDFTSLTLTFWRDDQRVLLDGSKPLLELSKERELASFSAPTFPFFSDLRRASAEDSDLVRLMEELRANPSSNPEHEERNGLVLEHGRIKVPRNEELRRLLMAHFHDTPIAGHEGVLRTYKRLAQNCTWTGMKTDVKKYVRECQICQRAKSEALKPSGLLQPLPIPERIWEDISMDFIEGLPEVRGQSVVFVVVDRLSKYAHFITLSHPFSAKRVAEIFVREVARLHGMPRTIVSDRDRIFISEFWSEFFRLQGTQINLSSAYHPETDGQTEVVNRGLEQYLRCFVADRPKDWVKFLPWAEWSYNTAHHSSIGMTPFEAVYGRTPPVLRAYDRLAATDRTELDLELADRDETLRRLKTHLATAQNRMKQTHDKGRREREFEVDQLVFVRAQPYRQSTLRPILNQKLGYKYYGPYRVLQRIGPVAYRLDLPEGTRIHPVFHVSALKAKIGPNHVVGSTLPEPMEEDGSTEPVRVLSRRRRRQGSRLETEVLIEWLGKPTDESTWELEADIMDRFPNFKP